LSARNQRTTEIEAITGHACALEYVERKSLLHIAKGLRVGQRFIGALDLRSDKRNFADEAKEELRDMAVYAELAAQAEKLKADDKTRAAVMRFCGRVGAALWMLMEDVSG